MVCLVYTSNALGSHARHIAGQKNNEPTVWIAAVVQDAAQVQGFGNHIRQLPFFFCQAVDARGKSAAPADPKRIALQNSLRKQERKSVFTQWLPSIDSRTLALRCKLAFDNR